MYLLKTGVYVISFQNDEVRVHIMDAWTWSFDNKPLIVKPWSTDVNLEREDMVEVPVWVRFPNLKLHLWSTQVLSRLASAVGKPLFTDKMTADKDRITFARVCVEIKVGAKLPEVVMVQDETGNIVEQKIEYEWLPVSCGNCGVFGHAETRCLKKPKMVQQWVVKKDSKPDGKEAETIMRDTPNAAAPRGAADRCADNLEQQMSLVTNQSPAIDPGPSTSNVGSVMCIEETIPHGLQSCNVDQGTEIIAQSNSFEALNSINDGKAKMPPKGKKKKKSSPNGGEGELGLNQNWPDDQVSYMEY